MTFTDVACTVCGCVCDDLRVTVENDRVMRVENACRLAEPWFLAQSSRAPEPPTIDGQPTSFAQAIARAAHILRQAKYPLVYGLSRSTTAGQRAAVALSDKLGASIDTTASTGHAPSIMALQQVGESTCTLGEVKQRADLIVFWGTDPAVTHPRFVERYCPPRPGRTVVVVDTHETDTAKAADLFVPMEPGQDWEALWSLRLRVKGVPADDRFADLAARMTSCKTGVVFFGPGLTRGRLAHRTIEALLQLVTDLNAGRRFYARRMRRFGDVAGADSVLAWQTGYPFGVNLSAGYPRYNPGEFTAPDMLTRGEPDAVLVVGGDTLAGFPPGALAHLQTVPVILLDPAGVPPPLACAVRFPTAVYGVHRPGTAYRLDEVPIPLTVLLPTTHPSDDDILGAILAAIDTPV